MKKKYIPVLIIAIILALALAAWLFKNHNDTAGTSGSESEFIDENDLTESDDDELIEREEGNGIAFDEESDGAVVEKVNSDASAYYGEWEATSDLALYLYGSIYITVKDDGTWEAEITDEPLGGSYDVFDDHLHMNDTRAGIFNFDLAFDKDGNLIMIDTESGEDEDDTTNIVLTRKQ